MEFQYLTASNIFREEVIFIVALGCLNVKQKVSDLAAGAYDSGYGCPKIPHEV